VSGTISPDTYSENINQEETVTLERTIQINVDDTVETEVITKPGKLDVLFLADNTGSMGSAIENVQEQASALLNSLDSTYGDVEIGVARYFGNPDEYSVNQRERSVLAGTTSTYERTATYANRSTRYSGRTYYLYSHKIRKNRALISSYSRWESSSFHSTYRSRGFSSTWEVDDFKTVPVSSRAEIAYELQEQVNGGSRSEAIEAIDGWFASGGGDHPEGNFFALQQAATSGKSIGGHSTNYQTNWRPDAKRLIVWFGDARAHESIVDKSDAIKALNDNDVAVIGINVFTNSNSINFGINYQSQASSIAEATGGIFQNSTTDALTERIGDLIEEVTTEVTTTTVGSADLNFASQGDTDGLDIVYTCTDALGCEDVKDGESRTFEMKVTGTSVGSYNFKTIATGVDGAIASNTINVSSLNPPTVVDDEAISYRGRPVSIPVLNNDFDTDGDELSISSVKEGKYGTVKFDEEGNVLYTPKDDAPKEGEDTFTYTATDGKGGFGSAKVTVELIKFDPD